MAAADLIPLSSFRWVTVPGNSNDKISIKKFVQSKKLKFSKGAGFYELAKPEIIQLDKRVLVQRISDPEMLLTGDKVKQVLEMNKTGDKKYNIDEGVLKEFRVFVQSTSYNRNLYGQSLFLYQKEGVDPFEVTPTTTGAVVRNKRTAEPANGNGDSTKRTRPERVGSDRAAGGETAAAGTSSGSVGAATAVSDKIEIVFSFDTTASMYPCLSTVRTVLTSTLQKLTSHIPGIRIGLIAHGDYDTTYKIKAAANYKFCGATDIQKLGDFAMNAGTNPGCTWPECYELVLREARTKFDWSPDSNKSLVLIGDAEPHEANDNPDKIDWRKEAAEMKTAGIKVYAVQCLDRRGSDYFYREVAELTDGFHLNLHQFSSIVEFIMAVCFHEGDSAQGQGDHQLVSNYESEVSSSGRMVRNLRDLFDKLQGRTPTESPVEEGLTPVSPSRFQVLSIDADQPIKQFAESRGLAFKAGRGFYEFTKPEAVSDRKELILMNVSTGDFYTGWEAARDFAGIVPGEIGKQYPKVSGGKYVVFIQSTSYNRKLIAGQRFLYEVDSNI